MAKFAAYNPDAVPPPVERRRTNKYGMNTRSPPGKSKGGFQFKSSGIGGKKSKKKGVYKE